MDLLSVFTYCIQYLALFLFIMTTQFQAIASFYYPSKFLTRLCDRAQTKTGNIQIFINMVLLYLVQITNTQNNKLCPRQLDTSSAIESETLLLQKYGTSASQIRASTEIMLQDQGRSNFKTFVKPCPQSPSPKSQIQGTGLTIKSYGPPPHHMAACTSPHGRLHTTTP